MSKTIYHPANTRGYADHGWLNANHSFSFAGYYDASRIHFGALRVLNDDTVAGGTGFGKHPHDNMEIITIVRKGALEHRDSMGHTQAINPGEVQVMSAGSGVTHSEYNHNKDEKVELFQIWIFPDKKNVEPRYDQKMFDAAGRQNKLQQLVSPIHNEEEGLKINQDAYISRVEASAGTAVSYKMHGANKGVYIMMTEGSASAEGQELNKRDALGVWDTDTVTVTANADSDILFIEVPMQL